MSQIGFDLSRQATGPVRMPQVHAGNAAWAWWDAERRVLSAPARWRWLCRFRHWAGERGA